MQRRNRLAAGARISEVHARGRSLANDLLVLRTLPNGLDRGRFCFIAGKRVGNAVVRNRTKRRLRELARAMPTAPGWDTILIARRGAGAADFARLDRAVRNLWRRANIASASPVSPSTASGSPANNRVVADTPDTPDARPPEQRREPLP